MCGGVICYLQTTLVIKLILMHVTASRPDQTGTASRYKKLPLLVQNSSPDSSDRSKLLLTEA